MKSYPTSTFLPPTRNLPGLDSSELFGLPLLVPADFSMEYTSGPVRSIVGPRSFVRLQPLTERAWIIEIGERAHVHSNNNDETIHRVAKISHSDVLDIYQEVILQDFFNLRGTYVNPAVFAGGRSSLRVVANGDTKFVSVSNTTVQEFRDVVAVLYDIANTAAH